MLKAVLAQEWGLSLCICLCLAPNVGDTRRGQLCTKQHVYADHRIMPTALACLFCGVCACAVTFVACRLKQGHSAMARFNGSKSKMGVYKVRQDLTTAGHMQHRQHQQQPVRGCVGVRGH